MKQRLGYTIIIGISLVTFVLWILSKESLSEIFISPFKSISEISALLGAVLISIQFVLATRWKFLESLFGGLDKVYQAHNILGGIGFVLILNHLMFLIINVLPNKTLGLQYILPSTNWSYNWGIIAFYLFLSLIFTTLYIKLPYNLWKKLHTLMGIPLFFILLHVLLIQSDISFYRPLRNWIIAFVLIAGVSYIYKKFLYNSISKRYSYVIQRVFLQGNYIRLELYPLSKRINYRPGQFVYMRTRNSYVGDEEHPFSISSSPNDPFLKLNIKVLGDYTDRLQTINPGSIVDIYGPYGQFSLDFLSTNKDSIWIAGGIGITPFLSMLNYHIDTQSDRKIWIYYCTKNKREDIFTQDILRNIEDNSNIKLINCYSDTDGRLKAENVVNMVNDISNKKIFLCGPSSMMDDLTKQFNTLGVMNKDIISEDFNLL